MSFQYVPLTDDGGPFKRVLGNRRAYVRYQCGPATPGRIRLAGQEWVRAWMVDLSVNGVGLLVNRLLETGLEVTVNLMAAGQQKVYELPARICHSSLQADGEWVIGFAFATKLTDDELEDLLQ